MSTQSTSTSTQLPQSEAPGGEMLASKGAEGVAVGLSQGLNPPTLSKSQQKKQRKLSKQQQQGQAPSQHYEKVTSQESKKEQQQQQSPVSEGISKESAVEQQRSSQSSVASSEISSLDKDKQQSQQQLPKQQQRFQEKGKESPILPPNLFSSQPSETQPSTTDMQSKPSLEPPLRSPNEQQRLEQRRKEVEQLEEQERKDRIERAERENLPELARQQAAVVAAAIGAELHETKGDVKGTTSPSSQQTLKASELARKSYLSAEDRERIAREAASEASLIGTVIDEERERQRRIDEDYPTYTEPLEKTKGLEEIERSRRMHSYGEKARQQLAASASAKLFPNAPRPQLAESKLWHPSGLLKREKSSSKQQPHLRADEQYSSRGVEQRTSAAPRFGQFIAATTKTTSTHIPGTSSVGSSLLQAKPFIQPNSSMGVAEITVSTNQGLAKTTVVETGAIVDFTNEMLAPGLPKVHSETYRSQSRPRLVVHHSGNLSGKWARQTETIELHEGVDF